MCARKNYRLNDTLKESLAFKIIEQLQIKVGLDSEQNKN